MARVSRFERGKGGAAGVYTCRVCGKQTRETGDSESSVELCAKCFYEGGLENEHSDGYHDDAPDEDCPDCKAEAAKAAAPAPEAAPPATHSPDGMGPQAVEPEASPPAVGSPDGMGPQAVALAPFDEALAAYLERLQAAKEAYFAAHYSNLDAPAFGIDPSGRKYLRVTVTDAHYEAPTKDAPGRGQKFVHVFVERETGQIWKAHGWKGPVKNFPRGNIFELPETGEGRPDSVLHLGT